MNARKRLLLGLPVLTAVLLLPACATTKIGRIHADPYHYRNKTVRVDGVVTNSFGAFRSGLYQVEDDTGKIFVLSNSGVPSRGARVGVEGTVVSGVTVGGRSFGTAIRERSHKLR